MTLVIRLKVARVIQPAELGRKLHDEIVFWKGSPGHVCEVYLRGPGQAYRLAKPLTVLETVGDFLFFPALTCPCTTAAGPPVVSGTETKQLLQGNF